MAQGVSHLLRDSWLTSASAPSPPTPTSSALRNSAKMMDKREKEIIHSGHFMVSHFEAEAQDDEDTELPMPDPDENGPIVPLNTCSDVVALSDINNRSQTIVATSTRSNNAIIDISLAKLFKCMNLAYRQKLTSPKWNSFKGIRLRWKDKIRLNNLIWRCWHMQFIMKKKTPVCQFASPLDVDLHSKPESVVLEGKYWKRQFDVIKAEYMKWRKFYRNRGLANAILDTVSEIDIFDWSPATSDKNLMSIDDYCWTADTLFSTINSTPFPFPDPREIARAGIADFIQPSLGPLQPNLDDFMNEGNLQDLINSHLSTRLAPVPEEGGDDGMYRGDMSYDFPSIMDSESMDSSMMQQATITDVTNVNLNAREQLTDPLLCSSDGRAMQQSQNSPNMLPFNTQTQASVLPYHTNISQAQAMQQQNMGQMNMNRSGNVVSSQSMLNSSTAFMGASTNAVMQPQNDLSNMTGAKKRIPIKERGLRSQLFGRREPHNYDKSTPTQHQTNLYNQMLSQQNRNQLQMQQQQQQQQQQQAAQLTSTMSGTTIYNSTNYLGTQQVPSPTTNSYVNALNLTSSNNFNMPQNQMSTNMMSMMSNTTQQPHMQTSTQQQQQTGNVKTGSNLLSLLSMKSASNASDIDISQLDPYKMASSGSPSGAYKPYSLQQSVKSASFQQLPQRNLTMSTSSSVTQMNPMLSEQQQQQLSVNTSAIDKEMFRSKSLPMNSTLQLPVMRDEPFVIPKYQASKAAANRIRARSNSMISKQQHHNTPSLQAAASEPMLKTLAQLLTSTSTGGSSSVTNLQQSNVLQNANVVSPNEITMSQSQQKKQINQFQSQFATQFSQPLSPDNKFVGSPSTSTATLSSSLSPGSSGESMQRRAGHIHAEQKRRYNIKNGFDMLHTLIPQLQQNPNAKLSKAAMLQKGAEYIKQLRTERDTVNQKMDVLRKERDALNNSLNHLHSVLPANGAPVSRQRTSRVKEMYTEYVREKTLQNWKFWILGLIFEPLLNSFNGTVSVASMEELYRSAMIWVDQHCSLVEIRPAVSDKLRYLSTTTDILSDPPSTLQEEVLKAISSNNAGSSTNLL